MARRAKTRIAVRTTNGQYELLSVVETPDKGLQLLLRGEINFEDPQKGNVKIVSEKISVHPGSRTDATTIKRSNPLEDGRFLTSVAFVHGPQDDLLYPVFSRRAPKLDERYVLSARERDNVVTLCAYNDAMATLVYSVAVSSRRQSFPVYPDESGNLQVVNFDRYQIGIYYAFINFGAFAASDYGFTATSPEQDTLNPVKTVTAGALSFRPNHLQHYIDMAANTLWRKMLDRIADPAVGLDAETLELASRMCRMVTIKPLEDLEQSDDQLPIIFSSSLPLCDGAKGVIISVEGKPCGKIFLD